MFHIELRKFPHQTHAFNLTEPQLRGTVIAPWLRNQTIEVGDQKWVPDLSTLVILEGPELTTADMSLGRGWSVARRKGRDVTQEMLAPAPRAEAPGLDDLARELLAMCADEPVSLHQAWRLASSWHPGWRASDRLVAAEGAVRALLLGEYAVLCRGTRATAAGNPVPGPDIEALLLAVESWTDDSGSSVFVQAGDRGRAELAAPPAADGA
jgi:hypothetical protein